MRSKGLLLAAMSMAVMGESLMNNDLGSHPNNTNKDSACDEKESDVPEGYKRLYFNKEGRCSRGQHTVYFDVTDESVAAEKFANWLKKQHKA